MRLISVENIRESDTLGKSIYSTEATLLLSAGSSLSSSMMASLKKNNIHYIYIEDDLSEGIVPESVIPDAMKVQAAAKVEKLMKKSFTQLRGQQGKMVQPHLVREYKALVSDLFEFLSEAPDRLYNMVELMGTDMYTYSHSVNVAVLGIINGLSMGMDREKIKHMALGGLMHDIGKAQISPSLLNQKEPLSDAEFDEIKNHAALGYDLIKDDLTLSGITKQIVYGHHERLNGTGYPRSLPATHISSYTRLIAISDIFDAMTSDRIYQKRMPVYKALDIMMGEAIERIDADILKKFVGNIAVYRPGEIVVLEDGRRGIVVSVQKNYATRPVVRIIENSEGETVKPYEIDLMQELCLFIKDNVL